MKNPGQKFSQDFICVLYYYENKHLKRKYAVIIGHHRLLTKFLLEQNHHFEQIHFFSDGCNKQFKSTQALFHYAVMQENMKETQIFVNIFPSYHGSSSCDSEASHAKKRALREIAKKGRKLRTVQELADSVSSTISKTESEVLQMSEIHPNFQVKQAIIKGLRLSFHHFTFCKNGEILQVMCKANAKSGQFTLFSFAEHQSHSGFYVPLAQNESVVATQ
eukprot:TRINITY_DN317_c0_g1_i1.p1 TRINITY_DN317_c0_g1~~TRINITY_DN317_c0_g1_i1.p1  ORF type:complete len:219 (+),score=37.33 TRINITY_DN317_c0_g1_i1:1057-1713(+)